MLINREFVILYLKLKIFNNYDEDKTILKLITEKGKAENPINLIAMITSELCNPIK